MTDRAGGDEALRDDRDRASLLTDASRMQAYLQERLPGIADRGFVIDRCEILHVRYRTSEQHRSDGAAYLSVAYELGVCEPAKGSAGTQLVHVKAYPSGLPKKPPGDAGNRVRPRFGQPLVHLADLNAILWAFPNDPKLPHLPELMDPQSVRGHLPYEELPHEFGSPARLREVDVAIVRYKPEVRCTTRYRLLTDGAAGPETLTLYGKTFKHARAPEVLRRIAGVWRGGLDDRNAFLVPRPLGCAPAVKTVWQEGLPGPSLVDIIDADNCGPFLDAAARGLASLHRSNLEGLPVATLRDGLEAARAESAEIVEAFPGLRTGFRSAMSALEDQMERLQPCRDGLIHGDFLLKQMVVHGDRLGVFDFDNFAAGDSIVDLATLLVDLRFQRFDQPLAERMTTSFLQSYRAAVDWEVPTDRVNWHAGVQLLRRAHYLHKRQHWMPGFESQLERLLALADRPLVDA